MQEYIEESLIEIALKKEKLVAFAGAGVSHATGIPLWDELLISLENELGSEILTKNKDKSCTNEDCVHTSFLSACNTHDTCYSTCNGVGGGGKIGCDNTFGTNLHAVCDALTGDERDSCFTTCDYWADTYRSAVGLGGIIPWQNAQVEACYCCPN